jgi:hypothetical protein
MPRDGESSILQAVNPSKPTRKRVKKKGTSGESAVNMTWNEKSAGENFLVLLAGSPVDAAADPWAATGLEKDELARLFGNLVDRRNETSMSFASAPTTTSGQGSSGKGSGSNRTGSRSGSSDGKRDDAADGSTDFTQSCARACDLNREMPPLPLNKFSRDLTECLAGSLRELLHTKSPAGEALPMPAEALPMPAEAMQMPVDPFGFGRNGFEHLTMPPPFEMPAAQLPAPEIKDKPHVQYIPVPCISTPYGFCPLPMPPMMIMRPTVTEEASRKEAAPSGPSTTVPATGGEKKVMLEQLLPDGRQRRPRLSEDTNRKVFVGGLNPATTAEGLRTHFEQFGTVADASVVIDKGTGKSRGFGFVMFEAALPEGLLERQHIIESRRCGVRDYGDAREEPSA